MRLKAIKIPIEAKYAVTHYIRDVEKDKELYIVCRYDLPPCDMQCISKILKNLEAYYEPRTQM